MNGRPWTNAEDRLLRARYRRDGGRAVAEALGRTTDGVRARAALLGVASPKRNTRPRVAAALGRFHPRGWTDAEIARWLRARGYPISREWVSKVRRDLGLPTNALHERLRRRVARTTRRQCRRAGLKSLAEVRKQAFRRFAASHGWPDDLPPRCVQILTTLYVRGPLTRREIAAAVGMPWRGVRHSLMGNGPGGSYLATLIRRGLVQSLARKLPQAGPSHNVSLYMLPVEVAIAHADRLERLPKTKETA